MIQIMMKLDFTRNLNNLKDRQKNKSGVFLDRVGQAPYFDWANQPACKPQGNHAWIGRRAEVKTKGWDGALQYTGAASAYITDNSPYVDP